MKRRQSPANRPRFFTGRGLGGKVVVQPSEEGGRHLKAVTWRGFTRREQVLVADGLKEGRAANRHGKTRGISSLPKKKVHQKMTHWKEGPVSTEAAARAAYSAIKKNARRQ